MRTAITLRTVAALMLLEAASLATASTLHLSGHVTGRGALFDADHAGIAEALIGTALAGSAVTMLRVPRRARTLGITANAFATFGFLWGLNITARAGHWPDITYHLVVLPFLVGGILAAWRAVNPVRSGS